MSIKNFIPELWAESMIRGLKKKHVFVADCITEFQGDLKEMGSKVHVPIFGGVTVTTNAVGDQYQTLPDAQQLSDDQVEVVADRESKFHFEISDLDKVQMNQPLMDAARDDAIYKIADEHDIRVASLAEQATNKTYENPIKVVSGKATDGEINVLTLIDDMARKMYERSVPVDTKISLTIPYRMWMILRQELRGVRTDNEEITDNGYVGKVSGLIIRASNNVLRTGTTSAPVDHIMCRTMRAIAFVEQLNKIKAYEPEKKFTDAVKGISIYGAKIIRPTELEVADITY
jgi:hypothetical protein